MINKIKTSYFFSLLACNNYTYGYQCSNLCACNKENTLDCDAVTGNCVCKENWNGTTCSTNVDDCLNGSAKCDPVTQKCVKRNVTHNYFCVCLYGKNSTGNGTCSCELQLYNKQLLIHHDFNLPFLEIFSSNFE